MIYNSTTLPIYQVNNSIVRPRQARLNILVFDIYIYIITYISYIIRLVLSNIHHNMPNSQFTDIIASMYTIEI